MHLAKLHVESLRCLQQVGLDLHPQRNIFQGDNGAGKTSVLEAIYLLSRGQSFRTNNARRLIREQDDYCLVRAQHISSEGHKTALALQKTVNVTRIRIGNTKPQRISELARICPALILEPGQHRLIEDGPVLRRRFLDWSVFHVEPAYQSHWSRFSRALKQRNQLLRSGQQQGLDSWTHEYTQAAEKVDALRCQVFAELLPYIKQLIRQFLGDDLGLDISYRSGWLAQSSLQEQLAKQLEQDQERGFTQSGPHRAELRVSSKQHSAKESLSRGQQKLLITAMLLAQANHFQQRLAVRPLLLVDDLASELGPAARQILLEFINQYDGQCFLTTLDAQLLDHGLLDQSAMFHVKHGRVEAMV